MHHKHFILHMHRLLLRQHILQVLRALQVANRLIVDVILARIYASGPLLSLFGFHVMVDFGLARDPLDLFSLLARRCM